MYVIPGNHESESDIARLSDRFGFTNLHGKSIEVAGAHIAALGYSSPTPFNTPGEYSEQQIAEKLKPFATLEPLVLICHCPPKDTDLDGLKPGAHFGSEPVRFFCGHIHECEGRDVMIGHTRGANVGKRGYLLDLQLLDD